MNLHEFIKNVLIDIDKAIEETRQETRRDISLTNTASQRTVEFDVAISVEKVDSVSGKAGIKVLQFAEAGGDTSQENKNSTVSRICFGVHINAMTRDEESAARARHSKMIREDNH